MKQKILVTGAGGFIGSHLVEKLVGLGHEVRAFVRYNARNDWGWLQTLPCIKDIEVYTGDIRDYDSVRQAVKGMDTVFHLAALIGIPYSYVSPLAYIKTNVEGTYNILQSAREEGIGRVVCTSTSEVYGTARYVPIDESHPLQAQSPYAATKIGADQLALSYYRSFGLPVVVIRPFNTFGPRQSARAIIPTIITQTISGSGLVSLGNLKPTRDLNYVRDTVLGMITVGRSDNAIGQVVNVGSGREISIEELVALIGNLMGKEIIVNEDEAKVRPGASEVERLLCDNKKALELAGWKPSYDLELGLIETIKWLGENIHLYKPDLYNV
ncbi:NAD-dependent 4,6-dehydratase LegB [Pelotomaculum terephthalicicum JT]|uniref:NAD-dependent 4,6-dehydratase LegB n=1 Tax=Pelotomaculum TaxID=191373 RepID=UPI0009CF8CEC|nr:MULTISPECIES: NAD-dependent 4,6-dehydratase LegB [Pelotomaculum]MCG9967992.1 NAD-dependent 4,6-dehydratase LegB [Pelotomaculum terephthalicicum JT]OPX88592.1 MAG: dTDP-glucose 4,6-dehydratase [Pelotomaculum sp. PtaB.Bin117]OPY63035.1 MAG: dTDP-glucose 4,6-dehydratase [Pelotomaculum sp. PtaU1.Bin065]